MLYTERLIGEWTNVRGSKRTRSLRERFRVTHRLSQLSQSIILDQKLHTTIDDTRKGPTLEVVSHMVSASLLSTVAQRKARP
jgi:hypothetical protein